MNRNERRARSRAQANAAAALRSRLDRAPSAAHAIESSQRLFQLGRIKEALPGLVRAVEAHPDEPALRGGLAYALAATGQIAPAIEQYRVLLRGQPNAVPVITNLALLLTRAGDVDEARELLARAAEIDPTHANTAFALAELLAGQDRREEAFVHYRRAARLYRRKIGSPPQLEHCDDLVKLASAQLWTGDPASALAALDSALALRPDHALALSRRGLTLAQLRRVPEAIGSLKRAAAADRGYAEARRALGEMLLAAGEDAAARHYLDAATRLDPSDEVAQYFLAAARHESPDAPPPLYVKRLFDNYAQAFDHHLVEVLGYRAPELVCNAVLELEQPPAGRWRVIDLGCGTGLCGALIRPAARYLLGVDLSQAMLDKARKKAVYDELEQGDVVDALARHADAFDLALCTDVMIYVGSLGPLFAAAARALRSGALFAFTTEVHEGDGFVVDRTKRYRHSRRYVESELAAHGFAIVRVEPIVARYQSGAPDVHDLYVARRNGNRAEKMS